MILGMGVLSRDLSLGAGGVTHDDDGTTILRGAVADQAELHGILTRIRDLGVTLISVAAIDPPVPPFRP